MQNFSDKEKPELIALLEKALQDIDSLNEDLKHNYQNGFDDCETAVMSAIAYCEPEHTRESVRDRVTNAITDARVEFESSID